MLYTHIIVDVMFHISIGYSSIKSLLFYSNGWPCHYPYVSCWIRVDLILKKLFTDSQGFSSTKI